MRPWIRSHLTYANVMVTTLAFVVLGGGSALAAVVITSNSQVAKDTISGHKPPTGKHPNIIAGSVTGQDVAKFSGVDSCTPTLLAKFGRICAGSDGVARTWGGALDYCSGLKLRLPSLTEAYTLANNYAVPGAPAGTEFWTSDNYISSSLKSDTVYYDSRIGGAVTSFNVPTDELHVSVCVANPTN